MLLLPLLLLVISTLFYNNAAAAVAKAFFIKVAHMMQLHSMLTQTCGILATLERGHCYWEKHVPVVSLYQGKKLPAFISIGMNL